MQKGSHGLPFCLGVCAALLAVGRFLVLTEGDAEHGEAQEEVGDPDPRPDEAKLRSSAPG